MEAKKFLFEEEVCSRCRGTGEYSYCEMYGKKCFKCRGQKMVLTKRGAAAQAYLHTLSSKEVKDLKVGDVIQASGMTNGGGIYNYWAKVSEIRPSDSVSRGKSLVNGVWVDMPPHILIKTSHPKFGEHGSHMFETSVVRYKDETYEDKKKQALEYQETLTKTGKPRKNKVDKSKAA